MPGPVSVTEISTVAPSSTSTAETGFDARVRHLRGEADLATLRLLREEVDGLVENRGQLLPGGTDDQGARLDARDVEEVLDESLHPLAGSADDFRLAPSLSLVERQVEQEVRSRQRHTERVPEVVRDDRHHILALLDRPAKRLFLLVDLGHVREGEHGPTELPPVHHRAERPACREGRPSSAPHHGAVLGLERLAPLDGHQQVRLIPE